MDSESELDAMMFSLFIDSNHVNRIITCIFTILFHIESFLDCLSLQNLYHVCIVIVIDV